MITKEQLTGLADRRGYLPSDVIFHLNGDCKHNWRRNGKLNLWKSKRCAHWFILPLKLGLYTYSSVSHMSADMWHIAGDDCDL